jgi:bifunctional non-homologous end joining protein LigD
MANLGCIELNPWLSRVGSLDRPDAVVIDLDPDDNPFSEVVEVAQVVHQILTEISAPHLCKTSGATGLHIFIPTQAKYDYDTGREFALSVCKIVHQRFPNKTSLERTPAKRRGKIYLDCFQNAQGQTVASVYSVRPKPGAPVSTPLRWEELTPRIKPESFNIHNFSKRIEKVGDLWQPILEQAADLESCLSSLRLKFPMVR